MRPRRHPARPGRAGTGLPGCRTSAAARTRAGSARASRRPAPARPFSKVQWSTSSSRSISTTTLSRDPRLTIARGTDKRVPGQKSSGNRRRRHFANHRTHTAGGCCPRRRPRTPVSADCGRQNGTSPGGKPSPIPRRFLSRRVSTCRAGGADIRCIMPSMNFGQRGSMRHRLRAYLPVMVLALVRDDRITLELHQPLRVDEA